MRQGSSGNGDPLPISLIAHTTFCPRRAWLESVGESVDSLAVEAGVAAHQRVDERKDDRPLARRSLDVSHAQLGITGRCDVIESDTRGHLRVVEFKSSPIRRRPEVTDAQRIQLALQGLCLKAMGEHVTAYAVYFTNHRMMVEVPITLEDESAARALVTYTRRVVDSRTAPPPLVDDPRCSRCSHAGVCLPDERTEGRVRRRIHASDPDGEILHLTSPGSRASLNRGKVLVVRGQDTLGSVPLERVIGVVVHGNVDVSGALLRELLWRGVSIIWCSGRGRVVGFARSAASPNGLPRQLQRQQSAAGRIDLAREFVGAKIGNQATQLRRTARDDCAGEVRRIRGLARRCYTAMSSEELLGVEGEAAAVYFDRFPSMIALGPGDAFVQDWRGRVGRGATDALNVSLNFVYGMLLAEVVRAVLACGLDPHDGFVHSAGRNKPALALDLMEQFRPIIADSVVLGAINNGELKTSMFTPVLGGARLRDSGRTTLIAAYERRVQQEFTHPVFRYRVTWRRAIEVQARMVLGTLDGTQARYVGIRTR